MESIAGAQPLRLFLIGLDEGLARSVARYVSGDRRVVLTGAVPGLSMAGILMATTPVDLVILDWPAIGASPADELKKLRSAHPGLRIVCVASEPDAYRTAATQAGFHALISEGEFAEGLESALHDLFPERFARPEGQVFPALQEPT